VSFFRLGKQLPQFPRLEIGMAVLMHGKTPSLGGYQLCAVRSLRVGKPVRVEPVLDGSRQFCEVIGLRPSHHGPCALLNELVGWTAECWHPQDHLI